MGFIKRIFGQEPSEKALKSVETSKDLLDVLTAKPNTGVIGSLGLMEWWLTSFTESERIHIDSVYRPFSTGPDKSLTEGQTIYFEGAAHFLWTLASWFLGPNDRTLAKRIITKAEEEALKSGDISDLHFTYSVMIQAYYPDRETDPTALDQTILACEKQISLAPQMAKLFKGQWDIVPEHRGYKQLAIIRMKQHNFTEAVRLGKEAMKGHWEDEGCQKRVARCEKLLREAKSKQTTHRKTK